ncbi:MAG: hypothetical protein CVU24_12340 [Betaproteobacteria bacterium HGW-Betaproteobacteria-18]|nr:MAG: hypothetical protein CVU24_12340 [Betaproteobacteria bacterium HGW-Betaproteobacteria-18]
MTIAWVIGGGGLLGSALCKALRRNGTTLFVPTKSFDWGDGSLLGSQMAAAMQAFAKQASGTGLWQIYWAAGVGVMSSADDALVSESQTLERLLQLLAGEPRLMAMPGAIAFASSAGAIYAGSKDAIITEHTAPAPTTAYAREKLKHEELLATFALANPRMTALNARISTVYGPGQAAVKQQGLLTHIARRILRNQPIQIYVPYDTIRDYIAVDDAAGAITGALSLAGQQPGVCTKIIASGKPTTIAEIISVFKRIARRAPLIVTSASKLSSLYARRVQFRSVVLTDGASPMATSLAVGIAQLMAAERAAFVRSSPKCTVD